MIGTVDESLRALLEVSVAAAKGESPQALTVWVDTAFNGGLVIPRPEIQRLGLKQASMMQAIVATGELVDVETYTCYLKWFGKVYRTQIIANDGQYPLLGTMLLADRKLTIDYAKKSVRLD